MPTSSSNIQPRIFDFLPEPVQVAIAAYADVTKLSPNWVIQFAIAHFLELEQAPADTQQNNSETGTILDDLPLSLQHEIKSYAAEQEVPPEFVVELAIAHFLDPDSVTFDDCQMSLQRDRVELLQQQKQAQQTAAV
ncbi:hypothetical protein [Leptolyngbya ohadii]|uniref:hypothetical protein n=1 Tax=Leptolyngbya ohadii TaxID=1962290 RepID=UPI000B5A02E1|nr:hypothetical protein [Leptolyngbya ohadii]